MNDDLKFLLRRVQEKGTNEGKKHMKTKGKEPFPIFATKILIFEGKKRGQAGGSFLSFCVFVLCVVFPLSQPLLVLKRHRCLETELEGETIYHESQ